MQRLLLTEQALAQVESLERTIAEAEARGNL
jgi:hypothetical protein